MTIRTRIAPSPTGDPHLGTAYMALFNWAFAKSQGGQFLLRIEDTDQARSNPASEKIIFDALDWLGLARDEGPDAGGPCGPYRQSERKDIYLEWVDVLLKAGHAFKCFCTPERLDVLRAEQRAAGHNTGYDGHCQQYTPDEVQARITAGEQCVVRMKVPQDGVCRFRDELRGDIEIPYSQIDMQVLLKTDGFPTYHLAVVVDDHLMGITHILRGEEWISSVPKHKLLYDYFGWQMPVMVHLPLLRNPDHSKLSKRKHPTSVNYYRDLGILPEALVNYLGMMGWSMPDEREMFSKEEMRDAFDLQRMSLGGPVFDMRKLSWLNGQYLRNLSADDFMDRLEQWAVNRERLSRLVPLIQERTERFADIVPQVDYLLGNRGALTADQFGSNRLNADQVIQILDHTSRSLDTLHKWERDQLFETCQSLADYMGVKLRDFLQPLFLAISGREVSLPLFDSMVFLGSDLTRVRIRDAIGTVGVSKKAAKRLEKAYQEYQTTRGGLNPQIEK
ncbi:MAG: glutamate--tRNA ligase [Proteobacteria bacterium]|nr:glutamate--tRNA ligase [Pseudomonadota bacterium]